MSPNHNSNRRSRPQKSRASNTRSFSGRPPSKLSHILTLPSEILSYIFELGTILPESDQSDDSNPFPHFAVLCSHVCRHFRQVALSTPQLWTYIDFQEGYPYETAQIFLQRSKEVPLTLTIDLTTGSEWDSATQDDHRSIINDMVNQSIEIYSMIAPHVHRWKGFELKADYYEIIWYWLQELAKINSASCLESFEIFCHEDWQSSEEFRPVRFRDSVSVFSGGTPRIKAIELWGVHFDWDAVTFLHGLRTLRLAWHARDVGMTAAQFVRTLVGCPELRELSLQHSGPLKESWPKTSITLEHLTALELAYLELDITINIIKYIKFPMLTELSLDLEQATVGPFIDTFSSHRNRFSTVQTLKLRSFECPVSKARVFLQAMPNLTYLNLNFHYLTNHFLTVLMYRRSPLCPKLNTLKLSGLGFSKLKKLLRSRPPNSITTLHLDKTENWKESEIRLLEKVVQSVEFFTSSDDEEVSVEEDEEDGEGYGGGYGGGYEGGYEEGYEEGYGGYGVGYYGVGHGGGYGGLYPYANNSGGAEQYDPHYIMYGDNGHMYDL